MTDGPAVFCHLYYVLSLLHSTPLGSPRLTGVPSTPVLHFAIDPRVKYTSAHPNQCVRSLTLLYEPPQYANSRRNCGPNHKTRGVVAALRTKDLYGFREVVKTFVSTTVAGYQYGTYPQLSRLPLYSALWSLKRAGPCSPPKSPVAGVCHSVNTRRGGSDANYSSNPGALSASRSAIDADPGPPWNIVALHGRPKQTR